MNYILITLATFGIISMLIGVLLVAFVIVDYLQK